MTRYSVVIPVYDSASFLNRIVEQVRRFFETKGLGYEILLVNDGSTDDTWKACVALAGGGATAIDLKRNFGQHTALMCGIALARGDWIVTMDDDLQNNPSDIDALIAAAAAEGADLVFGRYRVKRVPIIRQAASSLVKSMIRELCGAPRGLAVGNFRLFHRSLVPAMLKIGGARPNINCLALLSARRATDALVEHHPRAEGKSGYDLWRLFKLAYVTLEEYGIKPRLRAITGGKPRSFAPEGYIANIITSQVRSGNAA